MRIAFLHYRFSPNPDYVDLAQKLRDRGHDVWFGQRNESGDLAWHNGAGIVAILPGMASLPKNLRRVPILAPILKRAYYLAYIRRVRKFLKHYKIDVAQILPPPYLPQVFPLFMRKNTKFVFAVKQMNLGVRKDAIGRLKDKILINSRAMSIRYFYDHGVFDYHLTAIAVLGPNWSKWAKAIPLGLNPRLFEVQFPIQDDTLDRPVSFLYIGTISKFRQLEKIILAAKEVASITKDFVIDIIGPDNTGGYYHQLVKDQGLEQVVKVKPPVPYETIPDLMTGYDVGLAYTPNYLTWQYQPTIKILEYRAVGLPILSTNVAAHRDIVQDGINGVLVEDAVDDVAKGMLCFIEDRQFLHNCKQNAQEMREGLTAAEVAKKHEEMFLEILGNK